MSRILFCFLFPIATVISACNSSSGNISSDTGNDISEKAEVFLFDVINDTGNISDNFSDYFTADISDENSDYSDYRDIISDINDIQDLSDVSEDASDIPALTPEIIGFENGEFPKKGSVIFYNNWASEGKDSIEMISPDMSYKAVRLFANRVWSFGVNKDGSLLVFSTADPYQLERYGLNINDAVQNSWLITGNSLPVQISFGPLNDECHNFITDDELMMCRRANFRPDPEYYVLNDPYRILIYNLSIHKEEFLTPLDTRYNDYSGNVRSDGIILFNRNIIADRTIDIMSLNPSSGEINLLLEDANGPVLSQDGNEILFKKKGQNKIFLSNAFNLNGA
ncbi:MAG: hypothetical protein N3B13_11735, partial [Deltaproteobacteria bacterium]|nr:hypothetical protein [Deltaproteobacteria bacterium]